jgi:zinc protease
MERARPGDHKKRSARRNSPLRPCYAARVNFPASPVRLRRALRAAVGCLGVASAALLVAPAQAAPGAKKPAAGVKAQKGGKAAPKKEDKKKGGKPAAGKPAPAGKVAAAPAPALKEADLKGVSTVEVNLAIERVTLANGLRVVINQDRTSPTVAVAVAYDVGSRDEQKGRSGFAHLFEHMMFQGSRNLAKGEHFRLVAGHGGSLNGTTNADRTNYFEMLPQNELALALWLEADRMKSLDISAANFENQRKVVQEEYRMRYSNAAYGLSEPRLEELVFQGYWPYEHSTIGSMADLDAAELPWVKDFYEHHYGPNNAVLAIAGDVDVNEAIRLVHQYFDSAPKIEVAAFPYKDLALPEQTSQRTAVVHDDNARTPGVFYGWPIPPARSPDHYALEIAAYLLGQGESSRLHQLLVREKSLCRSASAGARGRRGPDMFSLDAKLNESAKVPDVEKLIEGEVKALSTRGPSDAEIDKARRQIQTGLVVSLQSNGARARRLADFEVFFGDARGLNGELARYMAVTKDDVKRVAAQYLGPTRRSIVETYPSDAAEKAPKKAEPAVAPAAEPKGKKGAPAPKPAKKAGKEPAPKPKKKK